jgi:folate-dependent phosphoribosylglycinamide formyltransferase PurN
VGKKSSILPFLLRVQEAMQKRSSPLAPLLQERGMQSIIGRLVAKKFKVALIVCNKPGAGVLQIAATHNIPTLIVEKERFFNGDAYLKEFKKHNIDFIVLAGFLWKIPFH